MLVSRILVAVLVGLLAVGPAFGRTSAIDSCQKRIHDVDPSRSLFVTERAVLEHPDMFTLEDLLNEIAEDSGDPTLDALTIWKQWWDTQNEDIPGESLELGAHCDDQVDPQDPSVRTINGFPIDCPRNEGREVGLNPFGGDAAHYALIALVNRFDLAPEKGENCGEYRAIFARVGGSGGGSGGGGIDPGGLGGPVPIDAVLKGDPIGTRSQGAQDAEGSERGGVIFAGDRNLVIFEAVLPNPSRRCGLNGCRAIAEHWEKLSTQAFDDPGDRARALKTFFIDGLEEKRVEPVVKLAHYSKGTGQIRTNQFMSSDFSDETVLPQEWQLREFKLAQLCTAGPNPRCKLRVVPVSVKVNPFVGLFGTEHASSAAFKDDFVDQVVNLRKRNLNTFGLQVKNLYNAGQSTSEDDREFYTDMLVREPDAQFERDIEAAAFPANLSAAQILNRAHVNSCAGCHEPIDTDLGDGLVWPGSLRFTHVSESSESPPGHFEISEALRDVFLPHRERVFERYLNNRPCRKCTPAYLAGSMEPVSTPSSAIVVGEGESLTIRSDELQALDAALKEGVSERNLGGSSRVH
ncbi:MAG: hypothetical protein VX574_01565 [Myxococcota bacterium]|nr:hypothetical protein [Myxococcota bacterium]